MAETPSTPTTIGNETVTEETTTTNPIGETNYDTERIKVTKWDMTSRGDRMPLKVTVDDVIYDYIYDELWFLKSIKGSDGTIIELNGVHGIEENRNGRIVKYIPADRLSNACKHKEFVYDGRTYTYRYENLFITGILDENNNLVAEYKYNPEPKGKKVEVINYTEDNIGDINSLRYSGYFCHEVTGFVFGDAAQYPLVTTVVNGEYQQLKG